MRIQQSQKPSRRILKRFYSPGRRIDPEMPDKKKVNCILKEIFEDAFQILATQSDLAVSKLVEACQNCQEMCHQRLSVPRSATPVQAIAILPATSEEPLPSRESLRNYIHEVVRDAVARILGTSTIVRGSRAPPTPVAPLSIRFLIQEEVVATLGPAPPTFHPPFPHPRKY